MAEHKAEIRWRHTSGDFLSGKYSREHTWTFDGGIVVPASPAPSVVRPPYSNEANVDPEEALVAAISSCHMLTFLHLASKRGFAVEAYDDQATGRLARNERGAWWVSEVRLRPEIAYSGAPPTPEQEAELHQAAHQECFIANSVKTEIHVG